MVFRTSRAAAALSLAVSLTNCFLVYAQTNQVNGSLLTFNNNGAWCWFQDPRVLVDQSTQQILLSSIAHSSGSSGFSRHGDVEVAAYNYGTGALSRFTLANALEADDHNSAALMILPDGRYLASYSKHSSDSLVRYRVSTTPGSAAAWGPEKTFATAGFTSYSNLYHLSESGDLFNFERDHGRGKDPNYLLWNTSSETFSYGGHLLNGPEGSIAASDKPYIRYTSNGVDRIDFLVTDDHPIGRLSNSTYHGYIQYEGGTSYGMYRSDGLRVGPLSTGDVRSSYKASDFTTIMAGNTSFKGVNMTRTWISGIELDSQGNPYVAFQARANDSDLDHRFFYSRFDGNQWNVHELAKAGGYLKDEREKDYTGLVALDPNNPDSVYISTKIDPRNDSSLAHYEIFHGVTSDEGASWLWSPITFNSTMDNIRPVVPKWDESHTALLWLRGTYVHFTNYNMDIVGIITVPEPAEFVTAVLAVMGLVAARRRSHRRGTKRF